MQKIEGKRTKIINFILRVVVLILAFIFVVPLYITIVNGFKPTAEISANPVTLPIPPIMDIS